MKFLRSIKRYLKDLLRTVYKTDQFKGSRLAIMCDILYCNIRFRITCREYLAYQFYNYKNRYRKNFLLKNHQKHYYRKVNTMRLVAVKYDFYKRLQKYFHREIILVPNCGEEVFLKFVKKHHSVILKPNRGSRGRGIFRVEYKDDEQVRQEFHNISEEMVCEEYIHQHDKMFALNPHSVNTVRIISIRHSENNIEIVAAALRTGTQVDVFVDNMARGGIVASVDVQTGIVSSVGINSNQIRYANHPMTQTPIIGMSIPNWSLAVDLVKKAHSDLSECQVLGWDIAITESGADIIEANGAPSSDVVQMADLKPKGEAIIKFCKNKKNHLRQPPETKK